MASRNINLHPGGYHPSSLTTTNFDVIILGAGPVANFAEQRLVKAGLSVATVQFELFGGDCHYFACLPSKALLRPGEALDAAKAVGGAREAIGNNGLSVEAIFKRRDIVVGEWNDKPAIAEAESNGITVIRGFGRIAGVKQVSVQPYGEAQLYHLSATQAIIVATGSTHVLPSISGIEELQEGKELWINRDATAANITPEHLIILGAGAVGSEMATFYSRIGSRVTLISSTAEILPKVEPHAAQIVRRSLEASGVSIKLATQVSKIKKQAANELIVVLSNGEEISGSVILNAMGRRPRTYDLGLESIGLPGNGEPLITDPSLSVRVPDTVEDAKGAGAWLYAIGDVNALGPTTHMGVYQARIASNAILSSIRNKSPSTKINIPRGFNVTEARDSRGTFPQVIFTEPNIAAVGYTLTSAQARGLRVRAVDSDFNIPGAMLFGDGFPGWARWIVEEGTEKLVGATFCCVEASEFVNASSVAIGNGLKLRDMIHVVPPFPTRGEIWRFLLDAAGY